MASSAATVVLEVSGVHWASSKPVTEAILAPAGVLAVDANPVSQTATVSYDPERTSVAALRGWVRDCGVPLRRPVGARPPLRPDGRAPRPPSGPDRARSHPHSTVGARRHPHRTPWVTADSTARMSMDAMVADMRNRFWVAAVLSVPVLLFSPIGREVFGFTVPAPFGLRDDVVRAAAVAAGDLLLGVDLLRRRLSGRSGPDAGHDGAGRRRGRRWLAVQRRCHADRLFTGSSGEVFYEAATVLTAFVLLGHWFEMRARGGANDAIRTLLELAPPRPWCSWR